MDIVYRNVRLQPYVAASPAVAAVLAGVSPTVVDCVSAAAAGTNIIVSILQIFSSSNVVTPAIQDKTKVWINNVQLTSLVHSPAAFMYRVLIGSMPVAMVNASFLAMETGGSFARMAFHSGDINTANMQAILLDGIGHPYKKAGASFDSSNSSPIGCPLVVGHKIIHDTGTVSFIIIFIVFY
jgi:hypothetical protein